MPAHDPKASGRISIARHLDAEADTLELGRALGRGLVAGLVVYLRGELGAGKTTLVRGILRGLGYGGNVKSPTYTLVELYEVSRLYLYHFDFYRIKDPREWRDAGLDEHFGGSHVCLVEWPERAGERLPAPDIDILLAHASEGRDIELRATSASGDRCLSSIAP